MTARPLGDGLSADLLRLMDGGQEDGTAHPRPFPPAAPPAVRREPPPGTSRGRPGPAPALPLLWTWVDAVERGAQWWGEAVRWPALVVESWARVAKAALGDPGR